ncbi:MAG: hypothetical protein R6X19_06680 [Kiritimatiellia bacterium]
MISPMVLFIAGCTLATVVVVIAALSIRYYIKAKELVPYLFALDELQRRIAEAQTTLEETKRDIKNQQDELAQAERRIADGKAAKEWLEMEAPKIEALRGAIETEQQKLKDASEAYQKRQAELNDLTQQVADKNTEAKKATENKDALEIEVARLGETRKTLNIQITAAQDQVKNLNADIDLLRTAKNTLDSQVKQLKEEAERLGRQLKEDRLAREAAQQAVAQARSDLANVQGATNEASRVLAELAEVKKSNAECWNDLDAPYIGNAKAPQASNMDETLWLEEFFSNLNKHHILFNERSVKAFHTGLKCADVSSLVVLAGISGTGKSLLPELYAASLGMNFLSVAVQPRWDSPQDLFGFYNYMEGRYKATELARLLWQFDKHNNPKSKQEFHQQIPMSLVLLDEMNLARVEYYFSDLLSKLETRNGIDPAQLEQRLKAEIEIECNASASREKRRRLFVGGNTLFVGTMNEDESTQTLSDKVIDRSNVLRFGRPKTLGAKPDKTKFLAACDGQQITEANWANWHCKNSQRVGQVEELLEKINEALDKVGRPFAHRVCQAIKSYIQYYPGNTDADFNAAVADQLEMKILPKLNGLEMDVEGFDSVKKTLEGIINKLNDEHLEQAFATSCRQHNSFFKWRGVMR